MHTARAEPLAAATLLSAAFWGQISSNTVLMAGVYGWAAAQIAKVPTYKVKKGRWDLSQLFAAGGMPSSHSALCTVRRRRSRATLRAHRRRLA